MYCEKSGAVLPLTLVLVLVFGTLPAPNVMAVPVPASDAILSNAMLPTLVMFASLKLVAPNVLLAAVEVIPLAAVIPPPSAIVIALSPSVNPMLAVCTSPPTFKSPDTSTLVDAFKSIIASPSILNVPSVDCCINDAVSPNVSLFVLFNVSPVPSV